MKFNSIQVLQNILIASIVYETLTQVYSHIHSQISVSTEHTMRRPPKDEFLYEPLLIKPPWQNIIASTLKQFAKICNENKNNKYNKYNYLVSGFPPSSGYTGSWCNL